MNLGSPWIHLLEDPALVLLLCMHIQSPVLISSTPCLLVCTHFLSWMLLDDTVGNTGVKWWMSRGAEQDWGNSWRPVLLPDSPGFCGKSGIWATYRTYEVTGINSQFIWLFLTNAVLSLLIKRNNFFLLSLKIILSLSCYVKACLGEDSSFIGTKKDIWDFFLRSQLHFSFCQSN